MDKPQSPHIHGLEDFFKPKSPMIINETPNKVEVEIISNGPGMTGEVKKEVLWAK